MAFGFDDEPITPARRARRIAPARSGSGQPQVVRQVQRRRGQSIEVIDAARIALPPGLRISKNGKPYHESRRNRSDLSNKV